MKPCYRLCCLLLAVTLAGCSASIVSKKLAMPYDEDGLPEQSIDGRVLFMECTGGYQYPAHIQARQAWLFLPEGTKRLLLEDSKDGLTYSNGEYIFWIRNDKASLETIGQTLLYCRNNAVRAIQEEARLRGVDYRAVGNEPGWYLEISLEGNSIYVGDYGKTRWLFKTPAPEVNAGTHTRVYQLNNGQQQMTVRIEDKTCRDTMSGEVFDSAVTINLGKKKLTGCGQALH